MVTRAAFGTGETARDPLNQDRIIDLELDDDAERRIPLLQKLVEGCRLRKRPREAVENKAILAVRLCDALVDDSDDQLVRNQLPALHDRLDLLAKLRARLDRSPQHVSRR